MFLFPCNKWLDTNEEDGKIERVLYPMDSGNDDFEDQDELKCSIFKIKIITERSNLMTDFKKQLKKISTLFK
jgi:hypothetical protein